jgi:RimJ/RimL family protein N-acetyltransferase
MPWPLHGLTLATPGLVLRGMTEADALALAAVMPDDLGRDPDIPSLGFDVEQAYWRQLGGWRVEDWVVPFTVVHEDVPIGVQALEGKHFAMLRVVDSYSWLVPAVRGKGYGKQMRAAVLDLAFRGLGATHAISQAWDDNAASLAVSRALGYVENGVFVQRRDGAAGRMQHLVLTADAFRSPWPVTITGLEPCLPLFGLAT